VELSAILKNTGASPASISVRGEGLAPAQGFEKVRLEGGEEKTIRAEWRLPREPGPASASLLAMARGGEPVKTTWTATVFEITPAPDRKDAGKFPEPSATPEGPKVLSPAEQAAIRSRLPSHIEYRLEPAWRTATAILTWVRSAAGPVDFQIQVLRPARADLLDANPFQNRLQIPDEIPTPKLKNEWTMLDAAAAGIQKLPDGRWRARVPDLAPGFHRIRITATEPGAKRRDVAEITIQVGQIPLPSSIPWILLGLLFVSLAYLFRKRLPRL
jgi:hypothetical protein